MNGMRLPLADSPGIPVWLPHPPLNPPTFPSKHQQTRTLRPWAGACDGWELSLGRSPPLVPVYYGTLAAFAAQIFAVLTPLVMRSSAGPGLRQALLVLMNDSASWHRCACSY